MTTSDFKDNRIPKLVVRIVGWYRRDRHAFWLVGLVLVFLAVNIVRSAYLGVYVDEAYWLMQTRHLAAGYFFHPPFIVYELFVITALFGKSALALRAGSLVFTAGTLVIVYLLALDIFEDKGKAFLAALMVAVAPYTNSYLLIGYNDPPLIFFTLLTVLFVWRALSRQDNKYWYLAGFTSGLMLLSNLRSVLILLGILLFLLTSKEGRAWLRRKEPYLGMSIMVLLFLPTLVWYASHHFQPITYQLANRPGFLHLGLIAYLRDVASHTVLEMIAVSPLLWLISVFGLLYAGYASIKHRDIRFGYLFWLSAPTFIIFTVTGGQIEWGMPAHVISLISGAAALSILLARTSPRHLKSYVRVFVAASLILAVAITGASWYYFATRYTLFNGWRELAQKVEETRMSMGSDQKPFVASPYYLIPSEVAYYCGYQDYGYTEAFRVYNSKILGDDSHYSPWVPLEDLVGKDFIFIDDKQNPDGHNTPLSFWEQKIRPYFERTEEPIVFIERRRGRDFRTFYIFKCYGFKGPDKQMDVKLPLPSSLLRLSSSIALRDQGGTGVPPGGAE